MRTTPPGTHARAYEPTRDEALIRNLNRTVPDDRHPTRSLRRAAPGRERVRGAPARGGGGMTRRALADAVSLALGATALAWVGGVLLVLWWWPR